ncbi:MAG: hypothetical protein GX567_14375 [Clostridia bacterium]|nr:hypothetical protein [Clostridia bacterium]
MAGSNRKYTTKTIIYLRMAVSAYIVYIAYDLIDAVQKAQGKNQIYMIIATAFLAVAGMTILILSIKALVKKEYYEQDEIEELEAKEKAEKEKAEKETDEKETDKQDVN